MDGGSVGGSVGSALVGGLVGEVSSFLRLLLAVAPFPGPVTGHILVVTRAPVVAAGGRSGAVRHRWVVGGNDGVADIVDSRRGAAPWGLTARGWCRAGSTVLVGTMIAVVVRDIAVGAVFVGLFEFELPVERPNNAHTKGLIIIRCDLVFHINPRGGSPFYYYYYIKRYQQAMFLREPQLPKKKP